MFGVTPEAVDPPPPDAPPRCCSNLADDADGLAGRRPDPKLLGPDWIVLRTRLTGICGSDTKQVLHGLRLGRGRQPDDAPSSRSPRCWATRWWPPSTRPAPSARSRARPAGRAQPLAVVRAPGHRRRCARPARQGDYNLCWNFNDGRLTARHPHRQLVRGDRRLRRPAPGPPADGHPGARRRPRRGRRPGRPVRRLAPRHHPQPAAGGRPGRSSTAPARWARRPAAILAALYPTSRSASWPASRAGRRWPRRGARPCSTPEPRLDAGRGAGRLVRRRRCARRGTGCPSCHPGGIDVVYDTVGSPETVEVGIRVLRRAGHAGAARRQPRPPGSSGRPGTSRSCASSAPTPSASRRSTGVRQHGIAHYLDLVRRRPHRPHRDADPHASASRSGATPSPPRRPGHHAAPSRSPSTSADHLGVRTATAAERHEPEHRHEHRGRPGRAARLRPAPAPHGPGHAAARTVHRSCRR